MNNVSTGFISVEVVYVDEHLVELATSFAFVEWSARSTAYTGFQTIGEFAEKLAGFASNLSGEVAFEDGNEGLPGFLGLKFYAIGGVRHLFCHLRLVSKEVPTDHRPEELWKVSVELPTEAAALDVFVAGLRRIVEHKSGKAILKLTHH